jgi:hypothetical protein
MMKTIHGILPALAAALLAGCGQTAGPEASQPAATNETAADVRQKTAQAVAAARDYTLAEKNRFVAATSAKLAQWNGELARLGHQADGLTGQAKEDATQALESLRREQATAGRKLQALEQSGKDAWASARSGMDSAMASLQQAYTNAKAKLESGR